MTADLKQKETEAWENVGRNDIRAATQASIAAALEKSDCDMIDYVAASIDAHAADTRPLAEALAPVLERVARLEELAQFPTLMAENDALLQEMADAPCATCNGARWVCDISVSGASYHRSPCPKCSKPAAGPEGTLQHNPGLGSVTMSTEQAAALLKSSKPAASPEASAPAATQGIPQSGPQAPKRVWIRRGNSSGLEWALIWDEAIGPLQKDHTEYVRADLLASAEAKLDHSQRKYRASCRHIEELAREDEEKRARLEAAERRIAELEKSRLDALSVGHATGREAGIREAAAEMERRGRTSSRDAVLDILAKKPEVGT